MMNRLICYFNYPSHYREEIYNKISHEFNSKFYFGKFISDIKQLDFQNLNSETIFLKTFHFLRIKMTPKSIKILFERSPYILMTGEYLNITDWILLIFGRLLKKRIFLWTHGLLPKDETSLFRVFVKKFFYNLAFRIFVYGEKSFEIHSKYGLKEKTTVIYNSVEFDPGYKPQKKKTQKEKINLLFIGRLTPQKRLNQLIDVVYLLNENHRIDTNLKIIGSGSERKPLEDYAEHLNLKEKIEFTGSIYDPTHIMSIFEKNDMCVSPGNVGLTALHSLIHGTPVVTHNNAYNQMPEYEIIDKSNGALFKENDINDIALKVIEVHKKLQMGQISVETCRTYIDERYNSANQIKIFKKFIANENM